MSDKKGNPWFDSKAIDKDKLATTKRFEILKNKNAYYLVVVALIVGSSIYVNMNVPESASPAECIEGRWVDDHGVTEKGDVWVISLQGGECILNVYYGGANPTRSTLIVGDKYLYKDERKYPYKHGAYYKVTRSKIKMYDKNGYIRTAYSE